MIHHGYQALGRILQMLHKSHMGPPPTSRSGNIGIIMAALVSLLGITSTTRAAEPVDEALARQAYRVAELWLEQVRVPSEPLEIEVADLAVVQVTLRNDGVRVGQGVAETEAPTADEPVDMMQLVARAMRRAIGDAASRVSTRDVPDLVLDIEFAHNLSEVEIAALSQLPDRVVHGLHGLALRRGDDSWAWSFPGSAIATNASLQNQINRLLGALDLPPDHLPLVGAVDGYPLYRFDSIHLVRSRQDGELLTLHRGNELLPPVPLDDRQVAALTDQLLDHLLDRQRSDGRFYGSYYPTADRYQPQIARPIDAATAAFALARASRLDRLDAQTQQSAARAAARALDQLTQAAGDAEQSLTNDLGASALALMGLLETPGMGEYRGERERLANAIMRRHREDGTFASGPDEDQTSIATHALATAALVKLYDRTRDEDVLESAHLAIDAIWQRLSDASRATDALPWLVIAELDLDRLNQPSGYRAKLLETTTAIWREQVQPWDDLAMRTPDVVGGFAIEDALFTEPTWQSARVLAGQARMLHHPTLIEENEAPSWLVHLGTGARFLAQLTMQPESAFYAPNADRAIGGTRASLSNNRQPLYATAMSLLATTEIEHALARLSDK